MLGIRADVPVNRSARAAPLRAPSRHVARERIFDHRDVCIDWFASARPGVIATHAARRRAICEWFQSTALKSSRFEQAEAWNASSPSDGARRSVCVPPVWMSVAGRAFRGRALGPSQDASRDAREWLRFAVV